MTRGYGKICGILMVLLWLAAGSACSKKNVPVQPGVGPGSMSSGTGMGTEGTLGTDDAKWKELGLYSEPERREFLEKAKVFENNNIHFGFDSYLLSDQAKSILNEKAQFLKRYPKVRVTIEGHCDDRGTNEYNLALGERRAHSAYEYLVNSGINADRLATISYGEERPLATGEDEAAWAQNRRDHFVLNY